MASYERKLRKVLSDNGCYLVRRGKGDHDIWYSPITKKTVAIDGKVKSRHSANGVLKKAGIKYKF